MIKLFSHYIRKILDSFRDSIRVIKHYDLIKLNGHILIFKIFIIKFFYSFSFIRNFKKIIYRNEIINSDFFEKNLVNINEDLKQIDELGYLKKFTGKSGSAFFEDSYGLHKGEPPKTKSRIILNVHFGADKILYSSNDIILNL